MTNRKMSFEVESAEIVDESPSSQFATAKITAFSTGLSRHDTLCDVETLKRTAHTLYEKPIIFEYKHGDFGGHPDEKTPPIISGFVVPNSAEFFERDDGRTSVSVFSKIWKRYAPQFMQVLNDTATTKKSVSVELEIKDAEETPEGYLNLLDFAYSAVCVLGDFVSPASPNAEIQMLSFAENENKDYQKAYELEFSNKYEDLDFLIPANVKENAKKSLETKVGASSVTLAIARHLVKEEFISPERLRNMYKFLKNKNLDKMDSKVLGLCGGKEGFEWSKSLSEKMDEIDSIETSFFEVDKEDFVYKTIADANSAIKGIKPPVTVAQANAIAKQADAVGQSDKVNGWAVAISNFKKTHVVEHGHWIKKESMSEEDDSKSFVENLMTTTNEETETEGKEEENMADMKDAKAKEEEVKKEEMAENEKADSPEEEKKESPEQEKKEEMAAEDSKKEETPAEKSDDDASMSLDANLDVSSLLEFLKNETKEYGQMASQSKEYESIVYAISACMGEIAKGMNANTKVVTQAMLSYMKSVGDKFHAVDKQNKAFSTEVAELRKFKADREYEKKEFEVNTVLKEAFDAGMPEAEIEACRADAINFSLDTIDSYKNSVKAKAFKYFGTRENEKQNEVRIGFPFTEKKHQEPLLWK